MYESEDMLSVIIQDHRDKYLVIYENIRRTIRDEEEIQRERRWGNGW